MTDEQKTWRELVEAGDLAGARDALLVGGKLNDAQAARVALRAGDAAGALELVKRGRMNDGDRADILAILADDARELERRGIELEPAGDPPQDGEPVPNDEGGTT